MQSKRLLALLFAGLMLFSGIATAQPPDRDPTCDNPQQSGQECAGDNGEQGCQGINVAEGTPAGEHAEDAFDLVTDILGAGDENECD